MWPCNKPAIDGLSVEKFLAKVYFEPNTGCWLYWPSLGTGYGQVYYKGKTYGAHRVSWVLFKGDYPEGMVLDHKCKQKCCVNPNHLEPVTGAENTRRANKDRVYGPWSEKQRKNAERTNRRYCKKYAHLRTNAAIEIG